MSAARESAAPAGRAESAAPAGLAERAARALPNGLAGHMSPAAHWPGAPSFLARAEGARFWDVDGREYIDMMCSWGPILLGHRHPEVEEAVARQHARIDCANGAAPVMVELAERMLGMVEDAGWALFAKNGSDVTTLSLTLARAHTGRRTILVARGAYHGALPWCNPYPLGSLPEDRAHLEYFDFNDLESVTRAADAHAGDLAGVIVSPVLQRAGYDQELPDPGFARGVRELCDRHGAVLIHDEVRTGMRLELEPGRGPLGSGWGPLGVRPDLSAWGKALGNGYAIAALLGSEQLRDAASRVYATGTFWYSADAMAAALATLNAIERDGGVAAMAGWGRRFCEGLRSAATARGIAVEITGPPAMPYARFLDDEDHALADVFAAQCGRRGLYLHPRHNWFVSTALGEQELARALVAVEAGLDAVAESLARR